MGPHLEHNFYLQNLIQSKFIISHTICNFRKILQIFSEVLQFLYLSIHPSKHPAVCPTYWTSLSHIYFRKHIIILMSSYGHRRGPCRQVILPRYGVSLCQLVWVTLTLSQQKQRRVSSVGSHCHGDLLTRYPSILVF